MVSIIMSVYNEPIDFLEKSINSVLQQTYTDFEFIIVIDNPSNLEICRFLENMKLQDSRIILLKNPKNMGLVYSLNRALKECKGEYIARMDADDISHSTRIEKQLNHMREGNYDLVGTSFSQIDENGEIIKRNICSFSDEYIKKFIFRKNCIAHPSWFVKKDLYEELNGYRNINYSEDYDFLLRAVYSGKTISVCNDVLLLYRINGKGISKSNMFSQYAMTHYLSSRKERIFQLDPDEANRFIYHEKEKYGEQFMYGIKCAKRAGEAIKNKDYLKGVIYRIKGVFSTRYNLYMCMDSIREKISAV